LILTKKADYTDAFMMPFFTEEGPGGQLKINQMLLQHHLEPFNLICFDGLLHLKPAKPIAAA
jgi:hypothetical protein